ncbi:hypothetical protein D3C81_2122980 [compost metagenome]
MRMTLAKAKGRPIMMRGVSRISLKAREMMTVSTGMKPLPKTEPLAALEYCSA